MQTVVRTAITKNGYWDSPERYGDLKNLLQKGWKVVMCNPIGNNLEYILEKEDKEND